MKLLNKWHVEKTCTDWKMLTYIWASLKLYKSRFKFCLLFSWFAFWDAQTVLNKSIIFQKLDSYAHRG